MNFPRHTTYFHLKSSGSLFIQELLQAHKNTPLEVRCSTHELRLARTTYSISGSFNFFFAFNCSDAQKYSISVSLFIESKMICFRRSTNIPLENCFSTQCDMNCSGRTTYFHSRFVFIHMNCAWPAKILHFNGIIGINIVFFAMIILGVQKFPT